MPVSPARWAAYATLRDIENKRKFAVDILQSSRFSDFEDRDLNLAMELVMGVVRWRGDLDFEIERLSGRSLKYFDPEVRDILRLGLYQIRFLSGIPKAAAVNESAELTKRARKGSAVGLVNAVLRKCEKSALGASGGETREYVESARRSIPGWMLARWEQKFGSKSAQAIVLASQSVPQTCIRVRGESRSIEQMQSELAGEGVHTRPGSFGSHALWVESGHVQATPEWREGRVVIQDEASQLIAGLLRLKPGQTVLDLCAAPGIKTSHIADSLAKGTIVACDRSLRRLRTMNRIVRASEGVRLHKVLLDAAQPLPFARLFDRILVDAPCSGTGTLARNPEIKHRLRPEDLLHYAGRQARMLKFGLDALAPKGRLVYATCSLETEENQEVVATVLSENSRYGLEGAEKLRRELPEMASLIGGSGFFQTVPGVHPLDGFFAAVLARRE